MCFVAKRLATVPDRPPMGFKCGKYLKGYNMADIDGKLCWWINTADPESRD